MCNSLKGFYCPQVSIVGQITIEGETAPVNVMLLEGELATSTDDCSMGICFS